MNDKKLSEKIDWRWAEVEAEGTYVTDGDCRDWLAEARVLEERVEDAEEAVKREWLSGYGEGAAEFYAMRERVAELERTARENRNWREQAEKECAELRDIAAQRCTQAEAAERKLADCEGMFETTDRAYREASDRMEHAEAEVARLREDSTWKRVKEAEGLYISMRDERDALRAKNERLRVFTDDAREQDLFMVGYKHMRTADALRAKLEKVRAYAECSLEDKEHSMSILRILDGEGGE